MKIRLGFVSNSSSCSFLIAGIFIEDSKDIEKATREIEGDNFDTWLEILQKDKYKTELKDFMLSSPSDYDGSYVGISYDKIGMDETGRQLIERAQRGCDIICNELKIPHQKVGTHEEAWRDG